MGEQTLNFQTIFEAIPGLYAVLTPDFVILMVSDAYLQTAMRKREDIIGHIIFDAFPDNPADLNATGVKNLRASLESVLKHRKSNTILVQKHDIRCPEAEGGRFEERYWSAVNSPVFGANGEITHIIHRVEDVTEFVRVQQQRNEQRQINQALQTRTEQMEADIYSRARQIHEVNKKLEAAFEREQTLRKEAETAQTNLQSVLSSLRDGFLTLDLNWCYTYINERQLEIIGMVRSDVIGRNIWEVFPDLVNSDFHEQLKRAMNEQTPIQFEYYYTAWNRWFENRVYPTNEGIAILCADITERKQAQAVQLFLAAIVESSNDAIIGFTPSSKIVSWNASAERIFGYTIAEILGQDISILIPDEKILEANNIFAAMQRGEAINQLETVWKCKDDQLVDVAITVSPIKNVSNQILGISATVRDIRERKKVELEREQLLAREQAARSEAERANRIKDEFLAVLSHELRSPLNPILGWSQLLQSGKLNATKTAEALTAIERNAKLQVQLVDDLLDVSKILRGKLVLNATDTNLSNVIFSALETVRLAADAKSLLIKTEITPMVSVIGDATRLQQVVWNLLSNAVKFTDNGGQIEVSLTRVGADAQIEVKDTGIGISSDFLPYVFEHFKQEDSSITRKFGGLGLGLAIVRQLVELHGGTITASSPGVGKGATFTVKIPLSSNAAQTTLTQSNHLLSDLSGVNILVVDDEPDSRELITFVLTEKHATVTAVASGLEALNAFATGNSPDLLISDIGMPNMDGYTLMQIIRASEKSKLIPAIAITAYAGELNEQEAIKAGFLRHIAKPINPDEVVKVALELI